MLALFISTTDLIFGPGWGCGNLLRTFQPFQEGLEILS